MTNNRKDFHRLHRDSPDHAGIITFTHDPDTNALADRIHAAILANDPLARKLTKITRPAGSESIVNNGKFSLFALQFCHQADKLQASDCRKWRMLMVIQGRVENGVVVLPKNVHLPEGQFVTVVAPRADGKAHSILDIPPVRLGAVLRPFTPDDDLLAEMLEGRS